MQADEISIAFSARFRISTTSNVVRALKLGKPWCYHKHDEALKDRPDLTEILHFSIEQTIASPPVRPITSTSSAAQLTPYKNKRAAQVSDTSVSEYCAIRWSKQEKKKSNQKSHNQQTQTIVENIQTTHGYSTDVRKTNTTFIGTYSPRNPNERWTCDPHPNKTAERKKIFYEAERCEDDAYD